MNVFVDCAELWRALLWLEMEQLFSPHPKVCKNIFTSEKHRHILIIVEAQRDPKTDMAVCELSLKPHWISGVQCSVTWSILLSSGYRLHRMRLILFTLTSYQQGAQSITERCVCRNELLVMTSCDEEIYTACAQQWPLLPLVAIWGSCSAISDVITGIKRHTWS